MCVRARACLGLGNRMYGKNKGGPHSSALYAVYTGGGANDNGTPLQYNQGANKHLQSSFNPAPFSLRDGRDEYLSGPQNLNSHE